MATAAAIRRDLSRAASGDNWAQKGSGGGAGENGCGVLTTAAPFLSLGDYVSLAIKESQYDSGLPLRPGGDYRGSLTMTSWAPILVTEVLSQKFSFPPNPPTLTSWLCVPGFQLLVSNKGSSQLEHSINFIIIGQLNPNSPSNRQP